MHELELKTRDLPIVDVAIDALLPGFSPRLAGQSEENIKLLSELDQPLPPLLVHRQTNRVIDGMHRLLAARRRGRDTISVRYYDGDESSAFVLAVSANVAHGLPLPLKDRKVAAGRIVRSHGHWSDRRIAAVTGVSDKTVAVIRRQNVPRGSAHPDLRVGQDGRMRALDAESRRIEVARLLAEESGSSLRRVAERAGVSPETVRAVKADMARVAAGTGVRRQSVVRRVDSDPRRCLHVLANDPSLRSTDTGRLLLRILSTFPVLEREADQLVDGVPAHDLVYMQRLALAHADVWRRLAERAALRAHEGVGGNDRASAA
jgi:hypothetical protein